MTHAPQATDHYVTLNGLKIHYREWNSGGGAKPPFILLHGIARVSRCFDHLAPHLAQDYRVIAVDMRGHGESDWHPQGAYLVEDYTTDIEALIDHLDLRDITLWGASTGGRVAQMTAARRADRVKAVVVEDVGPERPTAVSNRRGGRMVREAEGWVSVDELAAQIKTTQPRTADAIIQNLVQHGSRVREDGRVLWARDPAILKGFVPTDLWASVQHIRCPIVYVLGGLSAIVPPETQLALQSRLPRARVVMMAGLGHYPSDEKPEEFLAIVKQFLSGCA